MRNDFTEMRNDFDESQAFDNSALNYGDCHEMDAEGAKGLVFIFSVIVFCTVCSLLLAFVAE